MNSADQEIAKPSPEQQQLDDASHTIATPANETRITIDGRPSKPISRRRKVVVTILYVIMAGWIFAMPVIMILSANFPWVKDPWFFFSFRVFGQLFWLFSVYRIYIFLFDLAEARWPRVKPVREVLAVIWSFLWILALTNKN